MEVIMRQLCLTRECKEEQIILIRERKMRKKGGK